MRRSPPLKSETDARRCICPVTRRESGDKLKCVVDRCPLWFRTSFRILPGNRLSPEGYCGYGKAGTCVK